MGFAAPGWPGAGDHDPRQHQATGREAYFSAAGLSALGGHDTREQFLTVAKRASRNLTCILLTAMVLINILSLVYTVAKRMSRYLACWHLAVMILVNFYHTMAKRASRHLARVALRPYSTITIVYGCEAFVSASGVSCVGGHHPGEQVVTVAKGVSRHLACLVLARKSRDCSVCTRASLGVIDGYMHASMDAI